MKFRPDHARVWLWPGFVDFVYRVLPVRELEPPGEHPPPGSFWDGVIIVFWQ